MAMKKIPFFAVCLALILGCKREATDPAMDPTIRIGEFASPTNPRVTEMGDYIFRVCFTDPFQGRLLAEFARKTLKAQQVAILRDVAAPYSVGLAKFFKEPFLAAGGTVVMEKSFSSGDKD